MKKLSKLFVCILAVLMVLALGSGISAENKNVFDNAGLISADQAEFLDQKLSEVSGKQDCGVYIVTTSSLDGKSIQKYGDDFFLDNDLGVGNDKSGILFVVYVNGEDREFNMTTHGYAIYAFTDFGMDRIADDIIDDMANSKYALAFNRFLDRCDEYLTLAHNGTPVDVPVKEEKKFNPLSAAGISSVIALIISAISNGVKTGENVSVRGKETASNYIKESTFRAGRRRDTFLYSQITRTAKQKNEGKGGSTTHTHESGETFGSGGHRKF